MDKCLIGGQILKANGSLTIHPTGSRRRACPLTTAHRFIPLSDTSHMKTVTWPALNGENIDCSHLKDDSSSCKSIYARISVKLAWCVLLLISFQRRPSGSFFFMNALCQRLVHCRLRNALILKKCYILYSAAGTWPWGPLHAFSCQSSGCHLTSSLVNISRANRLIKQCILIMT